MTILPPLLSFKNAKPNRQEYWIYMPQGRLVRQDNSTSESLGLKGKTECNPDLLQALTSDEGPLKAGMLPGVKAASAEGQKKLLEALDEKTEVKKRTTPKRTENDKDPVDVKPKTLLEFLVSK